MPRNWWEDDDPVEQNQQRPRSRRPLVIQGPPREPAPQTAPQQRHDELQVQQQEAALAQAPIQLQTAQTNLATEQAKLKQLQSGLTPDRRAQIQEDLNSLVPLEHGINELEQIYREGFQNQGLATPLELLPGGIRPINQRFNQSAGRLSAFVGRALGLSGQQFNTPAEQQLFMGSYLPSNTDTDQAIENKIAALRLLLNNARASGSRMLGIEAPAQQQGDNQQAAPPVVGGSAPPSAGPPGSPPPEYIDRSSRITGPSGPDQMGLATGGMRRENDPTLAGVNDHIRAMIVAGASADQVNAYYRSIGGQIPIDQQKLREAIQWQRKTRDKNGPIINVDDRMVPMSALRQFWNNAAQSPTGAYAISAGDAVTLGTLDNMTSNPALSRAGMAAVRAQNPKSSLAGTVTGGAMMAGTLEGGIGRLGLQGGRAALAGDALYGAGYGAGSSDDGNRLLGAAKGGLFGVGGGVAGRAVGSGVGRVVTGSRDAATRLLTQRGVPLTLGQIAGRGGVVGRSVKKIEDALESVPLLGSAIRARRQEGAQAFNRAAFTEALEPIGQNTAGTIAEEGVDQMKGARSDAYTQALGGVMVDADQTFVRDMKRAMTAGQKLHPEIAQDFERLVQNEIAPEMVNGQLTGESYQTLRRILKEEKAAWQGKPRGRQYIATLRQVGGALEALVRRRAPEIVPALNRADATFLRSKVVEDAVGRAVNTGGIFTPAQLGLAARASGKKFGGNAATTDRPFFQLQRAGQDILPSHVPNSGTADRLLASAALPALPGLIGAGGAAAGWIDPKTAGVMAALGLPFTKAGQATFQALLVQRPDVVRRAGEQILRRRPVAGLLGTGVGASLAAPQ